MSRFAPMLLTGLLLAGLSMTPALVAAQETNASPQEFISFPDYQKQGLFTRNASTRAQAVRDHQLAAPYRAKHWWNRLGVVKRLTTPTKPGVQLYETQEDYDAAHGFREPVPAERP